jgi:hypothetical protein
MLNRRCRLVTATPVADGASRVFGATAVHRLSGRPSLLDPNLSARRPQMTTAKTKRWVLVDAPVERLLDEIGAPDLDYYSAGDERAVNEALGAWPLLAAVAQTLRAERAREQPAKAVEQPLRVVVQDGEPTRACETERTADPTSSPKEAG